MWSLFSGRAWHPDPPEGYTPVVAFTLCPPGGVYFDLLMWLLDYANDAAQLVTFALHGDIWFAVLCAGSIALSSLSTFAYLSAESITLWEAARQSVARGVATNAWLGVLGVERNVEAPVSGLIAPYGMALNGQLSPPQAASAVLGLLLSAKAMASSRVKDETHGRPEAAAIVAPRRTSALKAWRLAGTAAELSAFAVASRVLHPLLVVPGYALCAVANAYAECNGGCCVLVLLMPNFSMFGYSNSPLGLPWVDDSVQLPVMPGWLVATVTLVRFAYWAALCCLVEWPTGIAALGQLQRPMGRHVLDEAFLQPSKAVLSCVGVLTTGSLDCELESKALSPASVVFNALLLALCLVCTTVHLVGLLFNLVFNGAWRRGEVDMVLKREVEAKHSEIKAWGDAQLRASLAAASE